MGEVDACFLVDESEQNLDILLEGIQLGLHCFLISRQPTDTQKLEKIYRATKEAGVQVQFSHWPTLAPATQWMMDRSPFILKYLQGDQLHPIPEFRR